MKQPVYSLLDFCCLACSTQLNFPCAFSGNMMGPLEATALQVRHYSAVVNPTGKCPKKNYWFIFVGQSVLLTIMEKSEIRANNCTKQCLLDQQRRALISPSKGLSKNFPLFSSEKRRHTLTWMVSPRQTQ